MNGERFKIAVTNANRSSRVKLYPECGIKQKAEADKVCCGQKKFGQRGGKWTEESAGAGYVRLGTKRNGPEPKGCG